MTFLPGKQYVGWHGPAWRDLERDVACLLVDAGMAPEAAIDLTRASRPGTIERGIQVELVARWANA